MLESVINRTFQKDCTEGMDELINLYDQFADLVIADPPYIISRESNFHTMKDRTNKRTGTNFGEWDNQFDNEKWIKSSYNTLKDGGALIVFNDFKKASVIHDIATKEGFIYKDTLIWHKTNPMPRNRDRRYVPNIEMIQWFVKKGKWTFNRENEKYESCILSYPSESGGGFKRYHPTQKPVNLIEKLIRTHSNPDDIIIDPFMGSGTTGVACLKNNRNFIGFEINKEYVDISNERCKEIQSNLF